MRYFFTTLFVLLAAAILILVFQDRPTVVAQQPRRWISGDTLWYEIDSLPSLPSEGLLFDSMTYRWLPHDISFDRDLDTSPLRPRYDKIPFDYKIPLWDVYRRSVTVWGITISTGQASPLSPYPAEDYPNAEVLSFPLNRPK